MRIRAPSILTVLALAAPAAWAQQQAPPPPPVVAAEPVPVLPPSSRPPSAVAPAGEQGVRTAAPAPLAVVAPMRPASALPPDSVRPAVARDAIAPPAGAVALCADGAYIVVPAAPSECAAKGGLRVVFPHRVSPPPNASLNPLRSTMSLQTVPDTPPAGATMRCKDGTYLSGAPLADRCSASGGVAVVFPAVETPPPLP